jgi:hypothetical protein
MLNNRAQDLARVAEIVSQLDALVRELQTIQENRHRVRDNQTGQLIKVGWQHVATGGGSLRRATIVHRHLED